LLTVIIMNCNEEERGSFGKWILQPVTYNAFKATIEKLSHWSERSGNYKRFRDDVVQEVS